jgi:hypothetical protein
MEVQRQSRTQQTKSWLKPLVAKVGNQAPMVATEALRETAQLLTLIPAGSVSTRAEDQRAVAVADTVLRVTMALRVMGAMEAKVLN